MNRINRHIVSLCNYIGPKLMVAHEYKRGCILNFFFSQPKHVYIMINGDRITENTALLLFRFFVS